MSDKTIYELQRLLTVEKNDELVVYDVSDTSDTPTKKITVEDLLRVIGNPVGTIIAMYKKSSPSGYLYCDGSTFDETQYPLLYAYLGSNVLPDYREFALVGAEENTTDVYNASTNPTGTIHDHDVYTEGQAKDDQLQDHNHRIPNNNQGNGANGGSNTNGVTNLYNSIETYEVYGARKGTVTRGKRKAVYFYIKA